MNALASALSQNFTAKSRAGRTGRTSGQHLLYIPPFLLNWFAHPLRPVGPQPRIYWASSRRGASTLRSSASAQLLETRAWPALSAPGASARSPQGAPAVNRNGSAKPPVGELSSASCGPGRGTRLGLGHYPRRVATRAFAGRADARSGCRSSWGHAPFRKSKGRVVLKTVQILK
jgi:hypothetical protein